VSVECKRGVWGASLEEWNLIKQEKFQLFFLLKLQWQSPKCEFSLQLTSEMQRAAMR